MVFVTGGTGFIGAYIIRDLIEKGYTVRAIRRSKKLPAFIDSAIVQKVEWVDGDLLDISGLLEGMSGADAVIHSAATVSFDAAHREEMYKTNICGTENIVNCCIELNIPRLIHISSVAALGRTAETSRVTEEKKWEDTKANTHYAISKYKAEMEVWRGIGEGLNAVILNPGTVLGYGDWNSSSAAIFKNAFKEFPYYTTGINGFVDVEDIAAICLRMLENNISAERFILTGDNWSFKHLLETIADSMGKRRPYRHATPLLGQLAWRLEKFKSFLTGSKPLLTRETARVAQSKTYFDNQKILSALPGFSFTPLEETIRKAGNAYRTASILHTIKNG